MRCMKTFVAMISLVLTALVARADDPPGTILLDGKDATLTGGGIRYQPSSDRRCIGFWNGLTNTVGWKVTIPEKRTYRIFVTQSCLDPQAGSEFEVAFAGQQASGIVKGSGDWSKFVELDLGPVMVRKPGTYELIIRPTRVPRSTVMNLRSVKLVPEL